MKREYYLDGKPIEPWGYEIAQNMDRSHGMPDGYGDKWTAGGKAGAAEIHEVHRKFGHLMDSEGKRLYEELLGEGDHSNEEQARSNVPSPGQAPCFGLG